ncbi:hypothetical protein SUTMEG_14350 [Sutterella megalosphaeroides]|uniref:Uncharacterized protein n=1 Tax=Sutterella megalosphaeroides TaxID=2494234 RepID=A0A2Z6IAX6_9BURK|nr:hypothetical protein SUTMEG_14350 [Sutterella megalosphaeroides]
MLRLLLFDLDWFGLWKQGSDRLNGLLRFPFLLGVFVPVPTFGVPTVERGLSGFLGIFACFGNRAGAGDVSFTC